MAAAAGAVFLLSQSELLAIETIEIEGNHAVPSEQVMEKAAPLLMGESLLRFSYDEVEGELTATPFIEAIEFERDFPHTLRIRVRERQVAATLVTSESRLLLLSSDGYVLGELEAPAQGYPVLATAGPCDAGAGEIPDCQDVKIGVRFVSDIPTNFNHSFSDVDVADGYIRARTASGVLVIFGTLDDYGLKFEVLRQLLARVDIQGEPMTIDVSVPERPVTREGQEPASPPADTTAQQDDGAAADGAGTDAASAQGAAAEDASREIFNG